MDGKIAGGKDEWTRKRRNLLRMTSHYRGRAELSTGDVREVHLSTLEKYRKELEHWDAHVGNDGTVKEAQPAPRSHEDAEQDRQQERSMIYPPDQTQTPPDQTQAQLDQTRKRPVFTVESKFKRKQLRRPAQEAQTSSLGGFSPEILLKYQTQAPERSHGADEPPIHFETSVARHQLGMAQGVAASHQAADAVIEEHLGSLRDEEKAKKDSMLQSVRR